MPYSVRLMRQEDVAQVTEIDHEAFPTQWPSPNYNHELRSRLSHYIVACDDDKTVEQPEAKTPPDNDTNGPAQRLRQFLSRYRLLNNGRPLPSRQYIIGFTGLWIITEEAHITSIAVRDAYRRLGIGELLMMSAIDLAAERKASIVTLEVRASNTAAQSLYTKYGFTQVGIRRGYYLDDKEDALLMSTKSITSDAFQAHLQKLKQAHARKLGTALLQTVH